MWWFPFIHAFSGRESRIALGNVTPQCAEIEVRVTAIISVSSVAFCSHILPNPLNSIFDYYEVGQAGFFIYCRNICFIIVCLITKLPVTFVIVFLLWHSFIFFNSAAKNDTVGGVYVLAPKWTTERHMRCEASFEVWSIIKHAITCHYITCPIILDFTCGISTCKQMVGHQPLAFGLIIENHNHWGLVITYPQL